jgi:serine/threonine-protein kinase
MDVPEKLGKYLLIERIAVGGMAEIFKAVTTGLGGFEKILAIKRLHKKYSKDTEFINMLIDEAKISVQLAHGNIGQIFDLDRLGEHYFICMEYIDGQDLYRVQRTVSEAKADMPIDACCFIAREVCAGLDFAHRKVAQDGTPLRIIHRDISPQNILISWEGEVKIVDFGIAKAAQRASETESGIIKGKFYYMSPEHALGHEVDHRADVFSLGIVLHEALTDQLLYRSKNDSKESLLTRVRQASIKPPSKTRHNVPKRLDQIVMKALARDREDRYQSAAAFGDALGRYLHQTHPSMDRSQLASYMQSWRIARESTASQYPSRPDSAEQSTLMLRIDYEIDASSLIYPDQIEGEGEGEGDAAGRLGAAGAAPPMSSFDDDPFFSNQSGRPLGSVESDVFELDDGDIEMFESEELELFDDSMFTDQRGGDTPPAMPAEHRPGPGHIAADAPASFDNEVTTIQRPTDSDIDVSPGLYEGKASPPNESSTPLGELSTQIHDTMDEEVTRIYRPQAVLAGAPDADHGLLHGESEIELADHGFDLDDDQEPTVITTIDQVAGYRPERAAAFGLSRRSLNESTSPRALRPSPLSRSGFPWLVVVLILVVMALGAASAIGLHILMDQRNESTAINAPEATVIPAPTTTVPQAAAVASYLVTSLPPGARVSIDGRPVNVTPATIPNLTVGTTYTIRLEADGYLPHEERVTPGSPGEHAVAFSLNSAFGSIEIVTMPPMADISIDGTQRGMTPAIGPLRIGGLDTRQTYSVVASLPGHLNAFGTVQWQPGMGNTPVQLSLALVAVQAPPNTLGGPDAGAPDAGFIDSTPTTVAAREETPPIPLPTPPTPTATEDDEEETPELVRTETTQTTQEEPEAEPEERSERTTQRSSEEAEAARQARRERRERRAREDDSQGTREQTTRRSSSETDQSDDSSSLGRISVRAAPDAQVFIDDQVVATTTPLLNFELDAGTHLVKVYFVSLREFSTERRVRVVAGETRSVYFRYRPDDE